VSDELLRHSRRGAFILCLSEEILKETRRVLLAIQERRIESEVGYALEPLLSDEASFRLLHARVVPFLQKGQDAEGLDQAVDALGKLFEAAHKVSMRTTWRIYLG
jgi:uncharacterized membrane protein YgcG